MVAYEERFSVPAQLIGYVIGKDGSNRKMIETTYNVCVLTACAAGKDESEIILRGSGAEEVRAAKKHILENLGTNLDVDDRFVGLIIGSGGKTVRHLEKELDISIHNLGQKLN